MRNSLGSWWHAAPTSIYDWPRERPAAASSAYLTISEIFPLEIRAFAIAIFYAIGTLVGGVFAPLLFGWIIQTGSSTALVGGYLAAALLMIFGAMIELWIGVPAERQPLEDVAAPLSSRH